MLLPSCGTSVTCGPPSNDRDAARAIVAATHRRAWSCGDDGEPDEIRIESDEISAMPRRKAQVNVELGGERRERVRVRAGSAAIFENAAAIAIEGPFVTGRDFQQTRAKSPCESNRE